MSDTRPVSLRCHYCFHWEKGQRTKEQIADWLRTHRAATLGTYDGNLELASICPHPCGSESITDLVLGDDQNVPCECCNEGVSFTTGTVCVACNGFGWREP